MRIFKFFFFRQMFLSLKFVSFVLFINLQFSCQRIFDINRHCQLFSPGANATITWTVDMIHITTFTTTINPISFLSNTEETPSRSEGVCGLVTDVFAVRGNFPHVEECFLYFLYRFIFLPTIPHNPSDTITSVCRGAMCRRVSLGRFSAPSERVNSRTTTTRRSL